MKKIEILCIAVISLLFLYIISPIIIPQGIVENCKEFCSIISSNYGKVTYSTNYRDYICMCEHTDEIDISNKTYIIVRYLDYGVVKNVTQK